MPTIADKPPAVCQEAQNLLAVIDAILNTWQQLEVAWQPALLAELYEQLHAMTRQSALCGYTTVSVTTRPLEVRLQQLQQRGKPANQQERADILRHLQQLYHAVQADQAVQALRPQIISHTHRRLIYLLEEDPKTINNLSLQLELHGYLVKTIYKLESLPHLLKQQSPVALISNLTLNGVALAGSQLVRSLRREFKYKFPVIFLSNRDDMNTRLAAVRAQGDAYFPRPFDMQKLLEKLDTLTDECQREAYRVLIIDDTGRSNQYAKCLEQAEMHVQLLDEPMELLETLRQFNPSLLLINTRMASINGLELATVVRHEYAYAHLPIVFFAQAFDQTLRRAAMQGIADDFLGANISAARLLSTIINRIKNSQQRTENKREKTHRDELTGFYNRHYLLAHLELVCKHTDALHYVILLYLSLDNYRDIDRMMGLVASDALVVDSTHLLRQNTDKRDILARLNDNVFVIISTHRTLQQAQQLAEQLRQNIAQHQVQVAGQQISATCSIGLSVYQSQQSHTEQVLMQAAEACANAEQNGGNQIGLHDSIQSLPLNQSQQEEWHKTLQQALEKDHFYLVFQPVASLHGAEIAYYDVLLRLGKPGTADQIPAAEFMPMAAREKLLPQIDRWVIAHALEYLKQQQAAGNHVNFFLRITPDSIADDKLALWIREHLAQHKLPRQSLIFDLSKVAIKDCLRRAEHFCRAIKALGCRCALRDFDDKADSRQIFAALPIDFVKIHGELVQNLSSNANHLKAIQYIVNKVHSEQKTVIAPFVEDASSLSLLWHHQVDYIAGKFVQAPGLQMDYDFGEGEETLSDGA